MGVKKKIAWLDTVRVFASFAIIVAHYLMCRGFETYPFTRRICYDLASLGVFLFLAISGYLVVGSLNRSPNVWDFFKRRVIRVVIPFTVSFIFLSTVFLMAGLLDTQIAEFSPFYKVLYNHEYFMNLIAMFPLDMNIFVWLDINFVPFVGEWFMAVIIFMYLLAPPLKYCAERAPLITLAVSIAVSFAVFNATIDWSQDGRLAYNWWLVFVRIPEFLFGMILAIKRDVLTEHRVPLEFAATCVLIAYTSYFLENKAHTTYLYFDCEPKIFSVTLPIIYLFFSLVERLNRLRSTLLDKFNGFNDVSYPIMLIQHPIVFLFEAKFDFGELHSFGIFFVLFIMTWLIFYMSKFVKSFSESAERLILRRA